MTGNQNFDKRTFSSQSSNFYSYYDYENIYYCGTKEMNNDRPQKKYCDTNRNKSVNIDRLDNLVWNEILETIRESKVLRELKAPFATVVGLSLGFV